MKLLEVLDKNKLYPVLLKEISFDFKYVSFEKFKSLEDAKKEYSKSNMIPVRLITEIPELIEEVEV